MKYRVIQWGTGYVGASALRYILLNPKLELVGVKCFTREKAGKTAGELAGLSATGVNATQNRDDILALAADCVIYMPRDAQADPSVPESPSRDWFSDLVALLKSGKNVICSVGSGTHWRHMADGARFHDDLAAACREGHSTLNFTGFDPGFVTDALAFVLSSVVGSIREIRTWEIIDYGAYPVESTLRQLGFGVRPEHLSSAEANYRAVWGGAIHLLAEALGERVEEIRIEKEGRVAETTYIAEGGVRIERGTVAGYRFSVTGIVQSAPLIAIHHVTRMGRHVAPDWPNIGHDGGYRIEIDSYPPFRGEFPMGLPGGTGSSLADAMTMTAARCVNSVEAVVQARPGVLSFLDLPPIGGRYALAARS